MLHIVQNDPEVPPGNISGHLKELGIIHVVHHPYEADPLPELLDISALIVLGGAMGANDEASHPFLRDLKILIRQTLKAGIPYLGICLGGQLLAAATGGAVASNRWEELGTMPVRLTAAGATDRLFSGIGEEFSTFQWHHDSLDLPADAVLLAASPACPHQAFRLGEKAWGVQFHPEVTEKIIRDWCTWDAAMAARTEEIVAGFTEAAGYRATARTLLRNFLSATGIAHLNDRHNNTEQRSN